MGIKREYKRDIYSNYMVVPALEENHFEAKMLQENKICGIMSLQIKNIDATEYYYYDISSKQPICNLFERGQLRYEQIKNIINGIISAIEEGSKYLLNENDFILDTEYIYITLSNFSVSMCYYPGFGNDISRQFIGVIEYLMDKADHTDEKAVMLVYGLYKVTKQECTINNIRKVIADTDNAKGEMPKKDNLSDDTFRNDELSNNQFVEAPNDCMTSDSVNVGEDKETVKSNLPMFAGGYIVIWITILALGYKFNFLTDASGQLILIRVFALIIVAAAGFAMLSNVFEKNLYREKAGGKAIYAEDDFKGVEFQEYADNQSYGENIDGLEDDYDSETVLLADYRKKQSEYVLLSANKNECEDVIITQLPFIIGKLKDKVDFVIGNDAISRIHAKIDVVDNDQLMLTDMNSKNGTFINGERLLANETRKINRGDEIGLADLLFNLQ